MSPRAGTACVRARVAHLVAARGGVGARLQQHGRRFFVAAGERAEERRLARLRRRRPVTSGRSDIPGACSKDIVLNKDPGDHLLDGVDVGFPL